jgi:hypothetical protein
VAAKLSALPWGQVADLALIAALCNEDGDEVNGERAEGCYLGRIELKINRHSNLCVLK